MSFWVCVEITFEDDYLSVSDANYVVDDDDDYDVGGVLVFTVDSVISPDYTFTAAWNNDV